MSFTPHNTSIWTTHIRIWIKSSGSMSHILYVAGQLEVRKPLPITEYHPHLHPTHSGRPPPPNPSSDTSSWQPAPFNSLQHSLGLGNHWCSTPSVATTPAPSLVGSSHLGPYDGVFPMGCLLTSQKRSKVLLKVSGKSSWQRFVSFWSSQPPKCLDVQEMLFTFTTLTAM